MNKSTEVAAVDFNDENSNTSSNPTFDSVLAARLSRRGLLRGGVGTVVRIPRDGGHDSMLMADSVPA